MLPPPSALNKTKDFTILHKSSKKTRFDVALLWSLAKEGLLPLIQGNHSQTQTGGVLMSRKGLAFALFIGCALIMAGPVMAAEKQVTLTWTAGGLGGGWYTMAGGFADLIHSVNNDIIIKVIPGGGTVNPALLNKEEADLGWGLPFMNFAAYNGEEPFESKLQNLRAIAGGMSMNYFHFYVGADTPFKSVDEIFGQKKKIRIAISPAGTSEEWVFRKVLSHYKTDYKGLEDAGFTFFRGNYAAQAQQFKDRNVDAVFTFLALPGAAVIEASVGRTLLLLDFPQPLLDSLGKFGIVAGKIPHGTYPKAANTKDVVTACAGSVITTHKDVPADLVYTITKAINENLDRVHKIHASLAPYTVADGITGTGIPLHPGAIRYYKEKGFLK
jgi:TRAP transporter TAXI family solute receptor